MGASSAGDRRRELLERLLSKYERSRAFGKPAPWPRDVILRIDRKEFPGAFSADGREELSDLSAAARDLDRIGAARVVYFKGLPAERPREIRLGPMEVGKAYELARQEGFQSLGDVLNALGTKARALCSADLPIWMSSFLERLARGARKADLSILGMSRGRLKRERAEILDALAACAALARGVSGWERVVSERIFSDSKRLGSIRAKVADILMRADSRWEGFEGDSSFDPLETYGVRRKPGSIQCAGKAEMNVSGRKYLLEDFSPTAHIPEEWAAAWAQGIAASPPRWITTVENEFPFLSYVLEAGGPGALGSRDELAIYTAGFPSTALLNALTEIARLAPSVRFRHWGDADVGGLRIWWLLRSRLGGQVELFRTRRDWLEAEAHRGRDLNGLELGGLEKLRVELASSPAAGEPDVRSALELIDALVRTGKKVEQERW